MTRAACGAAMFLLLAPCTAHAQQPPAPVPEWFAGATLGMSLSRSGDPVRQNPSILSPAIGGSALEGSLTLGAFVTPRVGLSAELGVPRAFHVQQTWGRDATTWDNDHRDVTLSGLLLMRQGVGRVRLTGAIGGGGVWSRTTIVARHRRFGQSRADSPFSVVTETRRVVDPAVVAGADLSVALSSRVSFVPQFRVVFARRDESNEFQDQLASVLYDLGAGVRVRFR